MSANIETRQVEYLQKAIEETVSGYHAVIIIKALEKVKAEVAKMRVFKREVDY